MFSKKPESMPLLSKQLKAHQARETKVHQARQEICNMIEEIAQISVAMGQNATSNAVGGFTELFKSIPSLIEKKLVKIERLSAKISDLSGSTHFHGPHLKSIEDNIERIAVVMENLETKTLVDSVHRDKALKAKMLSTLGNVFNSLMILAPLANREEKSEQKRRG